MKVLQINSVCGIGSTGRIATDIHHMLIEQGHESYIAYGRGVALNCKNTIKIGTSFEFYNHVFKTRMFDQHGFGSKKATLKFIEEVKKIDPDVIHLHNIHGYYINIEILFNYLKKADKPVIWTLHDCWSFTGHCAHFDYIGCVKWKEQCADCPQKKEYPGSFFIDRSRENYKNKKVLFSQIQNLTIVVPSEWLANLVKESYLNQYPLEIINNGIDLAVFKPTNNQFRQRYNLQDKFIILGVANVWGEKKGFDFFMKLASKVKGDEVIVLVGLSKKQMKRLPENVVGVEKTDSTEALADIYSSADVFVNPTLEEVLGMTNIEALACGTPVITFNTGGSPECLNKDCGVIIEKKDLETAEKIIRKLKIKNCGKNDCTERAKFFNKNNKFKEYIEIYENKFGIVK